MKRTLALILALMMVTCLLSACGSKEEAAAPAEAPAAAPAEAPAAAPAEAPAAAPAVAAAPEGDASGEASGEASAPPEVQYYPSAGTDYPRDFEGYRQYCLDAFANDTFAPDDVKTATNAEFEAMTEENFQSGERWTALVGLGVFDDYDTFLASK
ncbi:MAG: hypothetical protein ACI3W7_04345 [Oscillospiraceae bacterium]